MRTPFPIRLAAQAVLLAIVACNLPSTTAEAPDAAATAAALTVQAQLASAVPSASATDPVAPPTNTSAAPPATAAATATSTCDVSQFVTDVTIPDGHVLAPGEAFTKTWRLKNTGTCSWTSAYSIVYSSGTQMGGPSSQALAGNVNPGQTVDLSISLTAPSSPGNYTGYWKLRNASGTLFAQVYVQIKVQTGGGDADDDEFAVTGVSYTLSTWSDGGHTDCPRVIASITANGAGTITFKWKRQDVPGGGGTQTLVFGSAGTQNVNYDWARGSVWDGTPTWVSIYVDDPNHQDFAQKNFSSACTAP